MTNTNTPIQWTDCTLNAMDGCDYESTGCLHCYAATLHNRRYLAWKRGTFPTAPTQYHQPFFHRVQLMPERLLQPFAWRTPKRVFFNSMSDLWHEDVPDWFILRTWAMMALTPQHTWQILTKRPERMRDWLHGVNQDLIKVAGMNMLQELPERQCNATRKRLAQVWQWPLPNVWLGVSVEDQRAADRRIPRLLETPAAVRFLSCEPLLKPVDLSEALDSEPSLDWVIVGGESGSRARPMELAWAQTLIAQCREAGVAPFMKQFGAVLAREYHLRDGHGGDWDEWLEHEELAALRVREFPQAMTGEAA